MRTIVQALVMLMFTLPGFAQEEKGIHFENNLNWSEILNKAKNENKYIFVDLYATWCGPCKVMDENIYPNAEVGKTFNDQFISVKVQVDKTDMDDKRTKSWYETANSLTSTYAIVAYPSFLFFAPDGSPAHKAVGARNLKSFIDLAKEAYDPSKQYYGVLKNYVPGKLDTSEMISLAKKYFTSGYELSEKIALDYLSRLSETERTTDKNIEFFSDYGRNKEISGFIFNYLKNLSQADLKKSLNQSLLSSYALVSKSLREKYISYERSLNDADFLEENNLKFFKGAVKGIPQLQEMAESLISQKTFEQWKGDKRLIDFIIAMKKDPKVWAMASQNVATLTKKDLSETYSYGENVRPRIYDPNLNKNYIIEFIKAFTVSTQDPGFKLLYDNAAKVDELLKKKKSAQVFLSYIISNEMIMPVFKQALDDSLKNGENAPDFDKLEKEIANRYNKSYADMIIARSRFNWYSFVNKKYKTHVEDYIKYTVAYYDKYCTDPNVAGVVWDPSINNDAWYIFEKSESRSELLTAAKWMKGVVERDPNGVSYIDTYANLLYKAGKKEEAIVQEQKACDLIPSSKLYKETLEKMKRNEPTWRAKTVVVKGD